MRRRVPLTRHRGFKILDCLSLRQSSCTKFYLTRRFSTRRSTQNLKPEFTRAGDLRDVESCLFSSFRKTFRDLSFCFSRPNCPSWAGAGPSLHAGTGAAAGHLSGKTKLLARHGRRLQRCSQQHGAQQPFTMRSSAPRVDDRYGIPLPHPASAGRPRPYDPISHRNSRGAAPPFSPASGPVLDASPPLAPLAHAHTAGAGQGDAGHNGEWVFDQDSSQSLDARAPRDVFDELHNVPEAGGAYRTPSPAPARLSHAMPQDIVTSMALSLGAPARPSRADESARRPATMRSEISLRPCQMCAHRLF
jgi:hypothetical protein